MCRLVFDNGYWWVCVFEDGIFTGEIEAGPFDYEEQAKEYLDDMVIIKRLDELARTFATW